MADIRINSLPTTASASSSDDFLALDGATNGTRKLNAFSPTFGGNATVGGTLTAGGLIKSTASGGLEIAPSTTTNSAYQTFNNAGGLSYIGMDNSTGSSFGGLAGNYGFVIYRQSGTAFALSRGGTADLSISSTGNATFAGNLTVSGTGNSSVAGNLTLSTSGSSINTGTSDASDNKYISLSGGGAAANTRGASVYVTGNEFTTGNAKGSLQFEAGYDATMSNTMDGSVLFSTGGTAVVGYFNRLGNLKLGPAAADSGNGKLQLATHTTSAGGIGFGTDLSVFRSNSGGFPFYGFPSVALGLSRSSGASIVFSSANYNMYIGQKTDSGNFFISATDSFTVQVGGNASNGTTALTLDSSQLVTVNKGSLAVGQFSSLTAATATFYSQNSGGGNRAWSIGTSALAGADNQYGLVVRDVTGSVNALQLEYATGNATFGGNIKTAAPSGGTAGAWKLGVRVAATTTLDTTQYLQVDIGGTLYKVALVTS
jgi:filamentous hemagglutinin